MADVRVAAVRYVASREMRGEWGRKSAQGNRRRLLDFAGSVDCIPLERVTAGHVRRWLERPNLSPGYRRLRLSSVRGFFQWCVLEGHLRRDPTIGLQAPKVPQGTPRALSGEEADRLLSVVPDARGRLVVLLMLQEGFRCVEVARLQLGDIDQRRATIAARGKGGSGQPTRVVPLSTQTARALGSYLRQHPASAGPVVRSYKRTSEPLTAQTLSKQVAEWMARSGVKRGRLDGKSAHALRHTMAQDVLDRCGDIKVLQQALGHATVQSTEVYLRGYVSELRGAMDGRNYGAA